MLTIGVGRTADPAKLMEHVSHYWPMAVAFSFGAALAHASQPGGDAPIIYVDATAMGAGDGTSWVDAYTDLQDGLGHAGQGGGEVWVAAGVYKPDRGAGDPAATFRLESGVAVYGGFAGWETNRCQRDWVLNETVLLGDLLEDDPVEWPPPHPEPQSDCCTSHRWAGCDDADCEALVCAMSPLYCDSPQWHDFCAIWAGALCCDLCFSNLCDNSFTLITAIDTDDTTRLDGFVITHGGAPEIVGQYLAFGGGGIYIENASPIVANCTLRENWAFQGAGMLMLDADPTVIDCRFIRNWGHDTGAMSFVQASSGIVTGCTFIENGVSSGMAGISYEGRGRLTISDSLFVDNTGGSAIRMGFGGSNVARCTFIGTEGNRAILAPHEVSVTDSVFLDNQLGGMAVFAFSPDTRIERCLFSGNVGAVGDALDVFASSALLVDSVVTGHRNAYNIAAISVSSGAVGIINTAVVGNSSRIGPGGVDVGYDGTLISSSSIFWGNRSGNAEGEDAQISLDDSPSGPASARIDYSIVEGWTGTLNGEGTTGFDPSFRDAGYWDDGGTPDDFSDDVWVDGDYRLSPGSSAINAGDPDPPVALSEIDYAGHPRELCNHVDIGPLEFGIGDVNCDQVVNLTDFAIWASCATGPAGGPYDEACKALDAVFNGAIDMIDYAAFQTELTRE